MAYNFKNLAEVELLNEVPEGATAIAEVNGEIKRVLSTGLGGGGVKTAIIKSDDYDNAISGVSTATGDNPILSTNCSCINMTFEEAYQTMLNGEPLAIFYMGLLNGMSPINCYGVVYFAGTRYNGTPCVALAIAMPMIGETASVALYWTADSISTEPPGFGDEES